MIKPSARHLLALLSIAVFFPNLATASLRREAPVSDARREVRPGTTASRDLGERAAVATTAVSDLRLALPPEVASQKLAAATARGAALVQEGKPAVAVFDFDDTVFLDRAQKPAPGAVEYVKAQIAVGARVVYLTGRATHEQAKTEKLLRDNGFPLGTNAVLMTNPNPKQWTALAWKKQAEPKLKAMGTVYGFFDNEPENARQAANDFPNAAVFRLATTANHPDPGGNQPIAVIKSF